MAADELQTQMVPTHSRVGLPVITGTAAMPGPSETYIAYGGAWSNVSNTPFRLHKSMNHEGGISTPLIAHWPNGITDDHGEFRHRIGHLIDIMATCVELGEAEYPETFNDNAIQPMEGQSLVASFSVDEQPDRHLMFEHYGKRAIRMGDWKLVSRGWNQPWELYNMADDRSELNNLIEEEPEIAQELAELWQAEAHRTRIFPRPGRRN